MMKAIKQRLTYKLVHSNLLWKLTPNGVKRFEFAGPYTPRWRWVSWLLWRLS